MMITGLRKLFFSSNFVQRTSHDFENNRKTLPMETNLPLLCWKVSQPPHYVQTKKSTLSPVNFFLNMIYCIAGNVCCNYILRFIKFEDLLFAVQMATILMRLIC